MNSDCDRPTREKAWIAVRLAVRTYARSPSNDNAVRVQRAWDNVQKLEKQAIQSSILSVHSDARLPRPLRSMEAQGRQMPYVASELIGTASRSATSDAGSHWPA